MASSSLLPTSQEDWVILPPSHPPPACWPLPGKSWSAPGLQAWKAQPQASGLTQPLSPPLQGNWILLVLHSPHPPIPNGLKSCLEGADQMEPFFPGPASLGPVADELPLGRSRMCLLQDLCVLDHVVILFESPLPSRYPPKPCASSAAEFPECLSPERFS